MISTHILDTSLGSPAHNVAVELAIYEQSQWRIIAQDRTNSDGRIVFNCPAEKGVYRLRFDIEEYYERIQTESFFKNVPVVFEIHDTNRKYHVPLLLNPYGYSTYRGS